MNKSMINGKEMILKQDDLEKKLIHFLREDLNLTGTKNGCEIGVCGSCTVLLDNQAVKSCVKKVSHIVDKELITIEGLEGPQGELHPLQQAFIDAGAIQCGFCTPGMVLSSHAFLLKNKNPSREDMRRALKGYLCRCTGYQQIVDAVELAAKSY
ncbi:MAG: (2Fe-2S)-binding protein [Spirochaetaceae bacterium]|jgi:carbon-monoxide dehydrogenase small subunit|nr:(2Fe-2S)-binding protein [Spirochaetaceae bacterium]